MHHVFHFQVDDLIPTKESAEDALTKIVSTLDSVELNRCSIVYDIEDEPNITGVTAVALLATGTVVITTYPEFETAFIDISSCQDYDVAKLDTKLADLGFHLLPAAQP